MNVARLNLIAGIAALGFFGASPVPTYTSAMPAHGWKQPMVGKAWRRRKRRLKLAATSRARNRHA